MKIGDKRKFNHPQKGEYEVKSIIDNPSMDLDWDWDMGKCPNCNQNLVRHKTYKLEKIYILENENGKILMLGETEPVTKDGKPLLMRLPDKDFYAEKDMTDTVKNKSSYLKSKETINVN